MKGVVFWLWRLVIGIHWSSSGFFITIEKHQVRMHLFTISIIEKNNKSALSLIIGPVSLAVGFAVKEKESNNDR